MKNNKKGFTLIELLAVIVILAIIALIATPIVLQIIAKARKSAAQDSLYGVMSATKSTYMETLLDEKQIQLPAAIECDGTDCKIFNATENADTKVLEKGTPQMQTDTVQFTVKFSGTVPGKDKTSLFFIQKDGKIEDLVDEDKAISVNGFKCTIKNENVTCK